MTPERWQQIDELFHEALACEPGQRVAFLASACAGDEPLRLEVESLISSHEGSESFIETPAGDVAAEMLGTHRPRLETGQHIDNYKIVRALGSGGMGEVYLAYDTSLNRKIALKLLPSTYTNDADRVRRFEQEARAASALNHPNIVTIHEIGESDSLHFIATEFVDGHTLREHMANTQMTVGEVLDVSVQLASALQAAHNAGIVHRDIKPENIMLRDDGIVKVLDFGLAKLTAEQTTPVSMPGAAKPTVNTNPGVVMGTVGYMSPEQARGQDVDARADIWSLGVVLYEMLARHAPFEGETASHVIVSILDGAPRRLADTVNVPAELEQIVSRALNKKISERYQTAGDLAHDLRSLKNDLEVEERLKRVATVNGKAFGTSDSTDKNAREAAAHTVPVRGRRTGNGEYVVSGMKRHRAAAIATMLIVLVGVTCLAYFAIKGNKTNSTAVGKKSIAVLPVKPIDSSSRAEMYEIGIADSLIQRISSMNGFVVRPLSAIRRYNAITQDAIAAGKEQQVDYVLASTYQLSAGRIRITAQLINVASGLSEATHEIEKDTSDVFSMQDAIAAEVGNRLLSQFASTSRVRTTKRDTTNEEAYRLYLQGMYLANNRNPADARKAVEALEQAVKLDSNYARAWAGLAYAQRTVSIWTGDVSTHEAYQKSIAAINQALALDENLSEAHSGLCENKYLYEWDFLGAETECKRAIELDPDSSQAHDIYSRYLMGRGRHEEAIAEIKTAIDLEPTSRFFQRNYGRALLYARRYADASTQFKRVLEMDPNFVGTFGWITSALALQGNEAEAFEWFLKLLSLKKVDQETVKVFHNVFETSGWHGVLRECVKRFVEVGGNNFDGAVYNAQIGNKDKAFEYLEAQYQRREIWMAYLRVEPRLDAVRDDPRFDALLKRVEGK